MRAIGGYFELELGARGQEWHRDAMRFQSSRAAFLALLRASRPAAVWVPWYICDSMLEPLAMSGTVVKRYALDERMRVRSAQLGDEEWLFYVNYFGVCERGVDDVFERFAPKRVVIDNAQAFFSPPRDCLATLYSPRKFFGIPDGGYLVTRHAVPPPEETDKRSVERMQHLLKRLDGEPEPGYVDYVAAEESLKLQEPKQMSTLTQRMLANIDYTRALARRSDNFRYLHSRLRHRNGFAIDVKDDEAPLCYPLLGAPPELRGELQRQRVYTPRYWPHPAESETMPEFERNLPASLLFLPCDQRQDREQLDYMVKLVLDQLPQ